MTVILINGWKRYGRILLPSTVRVYILARKGKRGGTDIANRLAWFKVILV